MRKYLNDEIVVWSDFFKALQQQTRITEFSVRNRNTNISTYASALQTLLSKIENIGEFNRLSNLQSSQRISIPPPSNTIEGQLILGLHENGRLDDAISSFLWVLSNQSSSTSRSLGETRNATP